MRASWRRWGGPLLLAGSLVALAESGEARPGGGSSFRGSSRSSGSSSRSGGGSFSGGSSSRDLGVVVGAAAARSASQNGGNGGSALPFLIFFGVIVVIVVVKSKNKAGGWSAGVAAPGMPLPQRDQDDVAAARRRLVRACAQDPNFSLPVFDDFASGLYTQVLLAHGRGELPMYSAYLSPQATQLLSARPLQGLTHALVGSMSVVDVQERGDRVSAVLEFESNLGRRDPATGREQGVYVRERWVLARAKNAKSRTPDRAQVFSCPNCMAPLSEILAGKCRHCGQFVASGAFDWVAESIQVLETEQRAPMLTSTTEEQGNDLPTIKAHDAPAQFGALQQKDPALQWPNFSARVDLIFRTFQGAWAQRDLATMRPYLSDSLFAVQNYWVSEYQKQGLRNVTERAQIHNLELARVSSDAFFDAITVRVWASSTDYTVNDAGKVVSGHASRIRKYTEYWTLIRSSRANGPARLDPNCPRCGAPLNINMGGNCTYCSAKVTSGDFDWVLSRIEQDEVYSG